MNRERGSARRTLRTTPLHRLALTAALVGMSGCVPEAVGAPRLPESGVSASPDADVSEDAAAARFAKALLRHGQFDSKRDALSPEDALKPFQASIQCTAKDVLMKRLGSALESSRFSTDFDSENAAWTATYVRWRPLATYCRDQQKIDSKACADEPLGRPAMDSDGLRDVVTFRIHVKPGDFEKCKLTVFRAAGRWFEGNAAGVLVKKPARGPFGAHRDVLLRELEDLFGSALLGTPSGG
ncbi:MAG: hypothetical protein U0441_33220 [Polyangiaceae bacterium]